MYAHINHQLYVQKYSLKKTKTKILEKSKGLVMLVAFHPILRALFDFKKSIQYYE